MIKTKRWWSGYWLGNSFLALFDKVPELGIVFDHSRCETELMVFVIL